MVQPEHAVIFHSRGMTEDDGTEAYLLLLCWVRRYLDPQQVVYIHCFSGTEYRRWVEVFPNMYCGFTNMVAVFKEEQLSAVRAVRSDRGCVGDGCSVLQATRIRMFHPSMPDDSCGGGGSGVGETGTGDSGRMPGQSGEDVPSVVTV